MSMSELGTNALQVIPINFRTCSTKRDRKMAILNVATAESKAGTTIA